VPIPTAGGLLSLDERETPSVLQPQLRNQTRMETCTQPDPIHRRALNSPRGNEAAFTMEALPAAISSQSTLNVAWDVRGSARVPRGQVASQQDSNWDKRIRRSTDTIDRGQLERLKPSPVRVSSTRPSLVNASSFPELFPRRVLEGSQMSWPRSAGVGQRNPGRSPPFARQSA
jgi:hypothetical protein